MKLTSCTNNKLNVDITACIRQPMCMIVVQKQYYKTGGSSGKYTAQGITKSCISLQNLKCNNFCIYSYRCGVFIKCAISCDRDDHTTLLCLHNCI